MMCVLFLLGNWLCCLSNAATILSITGSNSSLDSRNTWIWMKRHTCSLPSKSVWWRVASSVDDKQKQRPVWAEALTHASQFAGRWGALVSEESSEAPWLHYLEGQWVLTNGLLVGKHLSLFSLYNEFSYGTVAQGLPHTHGTSNKHVEPPRLKLLWSCDALQHKIQLVLLQRVGAAVTVGNGRRRGGVSDVVAALKTKVCR